MRFWSLAGARSWLQQTPLWWYPRFFERCEVLFHDMLAEQLNAPCSFFYAREEKGKIGGFYG